MNKSMVALGLAAGLALAVGAQADGAKNYEKHCLKCHGATGKGDGKAGKKLKPKPTDFSSAKWQSEATDVQIFDVTKLGAKAKSVKKKVSKKMPAYEKKLNDDEIKELVPVMRGFAEAKK